MHHRPSPSVRVGMPSPSQSPRLQTLLPSAALQNAEKGMAGSNTQSDGPKIFGLPLKYVSLVTLAVQNAALSIVMHYSRISTPPALAYSPASAVLLNEILKGSISFIIALSRTPQLSEASYQRRQNPARWLASLPYLVSAGFWQVIREVFSPDCWKLSIPAILYVIQNSLQFVAISNLPVATFQVTYQMKILTTAAFSVALLRKKLSSTKWLSLFFLAIGVGIVQIQTAGTPKHHSHGGVVGSAHEYQHVHVMSPMKGFGAVTAACFTSGLAGVYFEMVLKNSRADLWVRNVQLSLFSLIPALLPVFYETKDYPSQGFVADLLRNFGGWAWATVSVQVFGGLITAVVIKYSDNILKGFATSLSIILSFMASVWLFDFRMTLSFIIGASTVLSATWMYNQPPGKEPVITFPSSLTNKDSSIGKLMSPVEPIIGEFPPKKSSPFGTPKAIASALGINTSSTSEVNGHLAVNGANGFGEISDTARYQHAPYGSPYGSRVPSAVPSRSQTPHPPASNGPSRSGSMVNLVPLVPMEREASR